MILKMQNQLLKIYDKIQTKNIKIKIYGDKGYVMAKKDKQRILRRYNVKRSNQKEKNIKKKKF